MTTPAGPPSRPKKTESKTEVAKRASKQLRGTVAQALASDATHFEEADSVVLKFHGIYQQDDRDTRSALKDAGNDPDYSFMIRVAIPGGVLTADQYLALDALADECGQGHMRLTTRQGVQFHGVLKRQLKPLLAGINHRLLTTLAACGDVKRNVMATPAPLLDATHEKLHALAGKIAQDLAPRTSAYHEIWLDGEKVLSSEPAEPFYGDTYLPRKFKVGVALASDNSIEVYSYDCGLIAITDGDRITGFNLVAGGGLGMTTNRGDTIAALAQPVAFIAPEHAVAAAHIVAAIFRDHGNRVDRKHARLKYLIADWGIERFREEFTRRADFAVQPSLPLPTPAHHDYLGAHRQANGRWLYGVFVENGRVIDRGDVRMRTALRTIVERLRPGLCITADQNILFSDLDEGGPALIEELLRTHGAATVGELSLARRYSMACPALPTCGLALTESERVFGRVVSAFEELLETLGLADEPLTLRMTGCPNGCARPYTADIGFVGRKPGESYNIYIGGGLAGDRLADLFAEDVPINELTSALRPLLASFARERRPDERFSDFYQRQLGRTSPRMVLTGKEEPMQGRFPLTVVT